MRSCCSSQTLNIMFFHIAPVCIACFLCEKERWNAWKKCFIMLNTIININFFWRVFIISLWKAIKVKTRCYKVVLIFCASFLFGGKKRYRYFSPPKSGLIGLTSLFGATHCFLPPFFGSAGSVVISTPVVFSVAVVLFDPREIGFKLRPISDLCPKKPQQQHKQFHTSVVEN